MEAVGKAVAIVAVQGPRAVGPVRRQGTVVTTIDLEASAARVGGADLEPSGEDDAVGIVFNIVEYQPRLGDAIDAAPFGVNKTHDWPVEGWQILVIERWPLAELAVPRLQRLCRGRVLDGGVHPRADLVHLLEVSKFERIGQG